MSKEKTVTRFGRKYGVTGNILHHTKAECDGPPCVFHAPSLHAMIEEPMHLRTDWGVPLIERICQHNVGHPDPDSVRWLEEHGHPGFDNHGCDGCCRMPERLGNFDAGN